jgi:hypothetical protein
VRQRALRRLEPELRAIEVDVELDRVGPLAFGARLRLARALALCLVQRDAEIQLVHRAIGSQRHRAGGGRPRRDPLLLRQVRARPRVPGQVVVRPHRRRRPARRDRRVVAPGRDRPVARIEVADRGLERGLVDRPAQRVHRIARWLRLRIGRHIGAMRRRAGACVLGACLVGIRVAGRALERRDHRHVDGRRAANHPSCGAGRSSSRADAVHASRRDHAHRRDVAGATGMRATRRTQHTTDTTMPTTQIRPITISLCHRGANHQLGERCIDHCSSERMAKLRSPEVAGRKQCHHKFAAAVNGARRRAVASDAAICLRWKLSRRERHDAAGPVGTFCASARGWRCAPMARCNRTVSLDRGSRPCACGGVCAVRGCTSTMTIADDH